MNQQTDFGKVNISKKANRRKLGIKLQLLIGFFVFTAIIVALLWVFQIVLLNTFYESIKISEVKSSAELIKTVIDDEEKLEEAVMYIALEKSISISISDEKGMQNLIVPNTVRQNNIAKIDRLTRIDLFNTISASGGVHMEEFERYKQNNMKIKGVIYAITFQTPSGLNRLVMLETEITPLDATVDTLKIQLIWLTAAMVVLGIALALYIAVKISKPIVSINESAKQLATGDYNINFQNAGTKEISELAETLNYAAAELSKVDSLRRELIANVSHDLRTPLTMIKGYSEVMRDLPGENNSENAQILIDEASRLTDLVNDLLDLSRIESGKVSLNIERFNLTESIREILLRYDKLVDFTFIFEEDVNCENGSSDIYVNADKLKISQVIYNLINNAINYSVNDRVITIRQIKSENFVKVEVADNGEGIPGDKLRDIWDRYYKIDKEHKRAQVGTGIGLSIVKNILDLHNGKYGVSSIEGTGSIFWFELPVSETPSTDTAAPLLDNSETEEYHSISEE